MFWAITRSNYEWWRVELKTGVIEVTGCYSYVVWVRYKWKQTFSSFYCTVSALNGFNHTTFALFQRRDTECQKARIPFRWVNYSVLRKPESESFLKVIGRAFAAWIKRRSPAKLRPVSVKYRVYRRARLTPWHGLRPAHGTTPTRSVLLYPQSTNVPDRHIWSEMLNWWN